MDTRYYYSGARVKALETTLLSETQMELLLSAKDMPESYRVLFDTFLAPFLSEQNPEGLSQALQESLIEAKRILQSTAPDPDVLDILWLRYDFFNLKTIVKGLRAGLSSEEIERRCSELGKYAPQFIVHCVQEGTLSSLGYIFQEAYETANVAKQVFEIDLAMNKGYFHALQECAFQVKAPFVQEYTSHVIDLFNMKTRLRLLLLQDEQIFPKTFFAPGGTISEDAIATEEQVLEKLRSFGGDALWDEAIREYQGHKHFSMMEKAADDFIVNFLKEKSRDIFSCATLYSFFHARRNNVMVVNSIMVAKESGMKEGELRKNLRRLYA